MTSRHLFRALAVCLYFVVGPVSIPAAADSVAVPYGACGWEVNANTYSMTPFPVCAPLYATWWCQPPAAGSLVQLQGGSYRLTRHIYNAGTSAIACLLEARGPFTLAVSVNGGSSSSGSFQNACPFNPGDYVSQGGWLYPGDNVVRVDFMMSAGPSGNFGGYVDAQVTTATLLPVPALMHSWGALKAGYR